MDRGLILTGFSFGIEKVENHEDWLYEAFISCEYLGIKTNIDPVQRLSDPFMWIVPNLKTVRNCVSR